MPRKGLVKIPASVGRSSWKTCGCGFLWKNHHLAKLYQLCSMIINDNQGLSRIIHNDCQCHPPTIQCVQCIQWHFAALEVHSDWAHGGPSRPSLHLSLHPSLPVQAFLCQEVSNAPGDCWNSWWFMVQLRITLSSKYAWTS